MNNDNLKLVCVPITETNSNAFISAILEASQLADIVELRLDYLPAQERSILLGKLSAIAENANCKDLLLTFRPREQGGQQDLSLEDRRNFWLSLPQKVIAAIRLADFEFDLVESLGDNSPVPWNKVICSWHNFENTPDDLIAQYDRMAATPASIIKIATMGNRIGDCLKTFELISYAQGKKPVIALAMSLAGVATRILSLSGGAILTFGSLRHGAESATGQVTVCDLNNFYRVKELNAQTDIFGVIGFPVGHSRSPVLHNTALASVGYNGVYLPFEVTDVGQFITDFVRPQSCKFDWPVRGLSVTIPHKLAVMPYLDQIDATAKVIGAVNTIAVRDEGLIGFNTDVTGAMRPLKEQIELKGTRVSVIGAGGAARAICYGLNQCGAEVTIFTRDISKAIHLANEFKTNLKPLDSFTGETDIVINCTPVGMHNHSQNHSPLPVSALGNVSLVYDLIYTPTETVLLRNAKDAGCKTLSGLSMLVSQAAEQFRLWTLSEITIEEIMWEAINGIK
jgi:3-dehydroquinate dehydratase/shikimate dehydrogenase